MRGFNSLQHINIGLCILLLILQIISNSFVIGMLNFPHDRKKNGNVSFHNVYLFDINQSPEDHERKQFFHLFPFFPIYIKIGSMPNFRKRPCLALQKNSVLQAYSVYLLPIWDSGKYSS